MDISIFKKIEVSKNGDVVAVRFVDSDLLNSELCDEIGLELSALCDGMKMSKLLVSFLGVEHMSCRLLEKLLDLYKECKFLKVKLVLCSIIPSLHEAFVFTTYTKILEIRDDEAAALEYLNE